jgi:UDP-glucuronate 4-epimerase
MRRAFITGTAGFIGFHLAKNLLEQGWRVHGFDAFTDYYDVSLKRNRNKILLQEEFYSYTKARLENAETLINEIKLFEPEVIIHLAAQAGVRYSLEYPRTYIESNIVGTFNVMEAARLVKPKHLMMASTSSVYGANTIMPFQETEKADTQLTIYAATKKANELMAHSYAHLWNIPTTMFRFFTVYGSMGRPDLALFKFVDAIIDGRSIEIYNNGEMYRDFTYVDDLVRGIALLIDAAPAGIAHRTITYDNDSLSPVAPFRIVNIGNSDKVRLLDFIDVIEAELGIKAIRQYLPMQTGDVPATWADASLLKQLTGYKPETNYKRGIAEFVRWFRDYYNK